MVCKRFVSCLSTTRDVFYRLMMGQYLVVVRTEEKDQLLQMYLVETEKKRIIIAWRCSEDFWNSLFWIL
jgi:hypothetical protein